VPSKAATELPTLTAVDGVGYGFYLRFSVFLFFRMTFQKPMQLAYPNLTQMFHDEPWKPIYLGVRRSKIKVASHKNIASVGLCTLVSAGFF